VKVLSGGGFGTSGWIASGIDWAVEQKADVINLSLGGGYSPVIHNAIKKATAKGVIVVAAAGNSGREGVGYPGGLAETIGVSATGPSGDLAPYSSWGKGVDIAAPGGDKRQAGGGILQDTIDGKGGHAYLEYQGTSMATPHVAGAAAVLLSTGMEPEAVERTLLDTARPKKASFLPDLSTRSDWDPKYGYGSLDLQAALGDVSDTYGGLRFALGAAIALIATHLGLSGRFRLIAAGTAAVTAGGLFFLPWLPLPGGVVLAILAKPILLWPGLVMGSQWWSGFPLWLSAALPFLAAFVPGANRSTRPVALGFVAGIGAHLLFGAVTGTLNPWFMPAGLDSLWLAGNGVVCIVLTLALAGTEKIDVREAK
jgi:serine protease